MKTGSRNPVSRQWVGVGLAVAVLVGVGEGVAEGVGLGVGLLDGVGDGWFAVGEG